MSDLISMGKLIEAIKQRMKLHEKDAENLADENFQCDSEELFLRLADECQAIVELIEEQPKVSEWIPCSERLPEKAWKYLVTMIEGGSVHTSVRRFNPKPKHQEQNEPVFTKHLPYYSGWERATKGVIAWMSLPEPYMRKKVEE